MPLSSEWECLDCECSFHEPIEEDEDWGYFFRCPKCDSEEIVPPMDDLFV